MKKQLQFLLAFFAFLNIGNAQELEPSFGNNGIASTSFDFSSIYLYDMEVLPNGKFVSIGFKDQATNAFYLTQQLPNGDLDTSFNHTGIKQFGFGNSYEFAVDIDTDANGNFLIAGTSNGSYALARILPSGIFDSTFMRKVSALSDSLVHIESIEEVRSPTNLMEYYQDPFLGSVFEIPVIDPAMPEQFDADSSRRAQIHLH
jgi:hypothetical protein